jgi:hypothetical protein
MRFFWLWYLSIDRHTPQFLRSMLHPSSGCMSVYYTDSEDGVARSGKMSVTISQWKWYEAGTWGSGGIAPYIIHLVLDGGEQVSSRPGRFNPGKEPLVLDKWVSRDSAVGIVSRLDAERSRKRGSISGGGKRFICIFYRRSRPALGPFSLLFIEDNDPPVRGKAARA